MLTNNLAPPELRIIRSKHCVLSWPASATNCKVVQVTLLCSRSLLGTKANNATMQSAKIVIRKQK